MARQGRLFTLVLLGVLGAVVPAHAQGTDGGTLTGLIDRLFDPPVPYNPLNEPLLAQAEYLRRQQDSREGMAIGLSSALASFPLGASSAGFAYVVDPKLGDRTLKAVSFGSVFVERAHTNGRGVLNLGASFQTASFDVLQGVDLRDEGFPLRSQLGTYTSDGSGVGDAYRATFEMDSRIFVFSGSYGLTDRLDLGWAVPVASVSARGQIFRDYNGAKDWDANLFIGGVFVRDLYPNKVGTLTEFDQSVSASGIGDVVVRAKFAFGPIARQSALLSAELRLPTGDEANLLGTGKTTLRVVAGASKSLGAGSVNVNGGYSLGGLADEINLAVGAEVGVLARKQLTLAFDLITQTLRDTVTSTENLVSFNQLGTNDAGERRIVVSYGFWNRGTTTLARAAAGAKYAIRNNLLLTGSVLFRLNDNGYQPGVVPLIGLEHTWSGQ
jgi:hypothetical protein